MATPADSIEFSPQQMQALALARARRRRELSGNTFARFDAGVSRGFAKTVGAPVDIVAGLLNLARGAFGAEPLQEQFGGSESIMSGLERLGMGVSPDVDLGKAGRVGEVVGMAAPVGPAIVGAGIRSAAARTLPVVPGAQTGSVGVTASQPGLAGTIVEGIASTAIASPGAFITGEMLAASMAGLASAEAMERFPDSPGVQAAAEIVGGFSPAIAVIGARGIGKGLVNLSATIPLLGSIVIRGARNIVSAVLPKGAKARAEARVQRAVEDPAKTVRSMRRTDVLEGLTPIQKTEEESLLALEASVMASTDELSLGRQRQFADMNQTIRDSLTASTQEVPTAQVKEYFQGLLDARLRIAALKSDETIAQLGTSATREDINRIVRQELVSARVAAREQEKQLYNAIPQDARVPTRSGQETYIDAFLDLGAAQKDDIPAVAQKFLDPASKDFLGANTTVKEVRALQSKLREVARQSGAAKEFNKARIADDLAESLNDDIASAVGGPEVRESVDLATSFSKDFNDRFTRGAVGRLMASERTGGVAVPEGLTLEVTVGARGPRAREDTDALLEAVRRSGDEDSMRQHISEFLIDDFRRAAVGQNRVDTVAAERWLTDNQDVLARFPETRRMLQQAKDAGGRFIEAERAFDPKISRTAVFIDAPPGREIERVINTSKPREAMQQLVRLAETDPTGKALQGLKSAFMNNLVARSEITATIDINDIPFVSGKRLTSEMKDPQIQEAMLGLFTREEIRRLDKIRNTAIAMDRARAASPATEGVIGDMPGKVSSMMVRILGAQLGRFVAARTSGGTVQTPGIVASESAALQRAGIQDPAKRLLFDAVTAKDDSLLKALLIPPNTVEKQRAIRGRVHAWVIDVLAQQQAFDKEEKE